MGATIEVEDGRTTAGEPSGTVRVRYGTLTPTVGFRVRGGRRLRGGEVDALATHGGELHVTGAHELRVKESDRISALADGLRRMGADIEEQPEPAGRHLGLVLRSRSSPSQTAICSAFDVPKPC